MLIGTANKAYGDEFRAAGGRGLQQAAAPRYPVFMNPRIKKLIGTIALLPAIAIYFFAAAALGERVPAFWPAQVVYYLAAGLFWALPTLALIKWMNAERPEKDH